MRRLQITPPLTVSEDHILVDLKIKFLLKGNEFFSDGVDKLLHTISYGGTGRFSEEKESAREKYKIKVTNFHNDDQDRGNITIAIPVKLCSPNIGIPHVLSTIMYASVYSFIAEYHVLNMVFPDVFLKGLPIPKFGTSIFSENDEDNLKIGLILKPRSILNPSIANNIIGEAVRAGIDYIIDDELTIDPEEWRFADRVEFIVNILTELNREHNKNVKYIANISGSYKTSMKLAKLADQLGVDGVMVNTITMGYDVVQELARNKKFNRFIVANVIGRNLMAGGSNYLVSDHLHSFLARISGADAVYTGPFVSNINSRTEKASYFETDLTDPLSKKRPIKKCFAVMSGGLDPKNLLENYRVYSSPVMFSLGSALCNLIEEKYSIEIVLDIIKKVFEAERKGQETEVKNVITALALNNKEYKKVLIKLGWNS